jgi:hypothetical protein
MRAVAPGARRENRAFLDRDQIFGPGAIHTPITESWVFTGRTKHSQIGEIEMLKSNLVGAVIALSVALPLALAGTASAQTKAKKLTYEQAWAECKKDLGFLGGDAATSAGRYTRGAGCMKQHGYRLKKSSMNQ